MRPPRKRGSGVATPLTERGDCGSPTAEPHLGGRADEAKPAVIEEKINLSDCRFRPLEKRADGQERSSNRLLKEGKGYKEGSRWHRQRLMVRAAGGQIGISPTFLSFVRLFVSFRFFFRSPRHTIVKRKQKNPLPVPPRKAGRD